MTVSSVWTHRIKKTQMLSKMILMVKEKFDNDSKKLMSLASGNTLQIIGKRDERRETVYGQRLSTRLASIDNQI